MSAGVGVMHIGMYKMQSKTDFVNELKLKKLAVIILLGIFCIPSREYFLVWSVIHERA